MHDYMTSRALQEEKLRQALSRPRPSPRSLPIKGQRIYPVIGWMLMATTRFRLRAAERKTV